MSSIRLDKLLSNLGYGSRREIAMLAKAGEITLHGEALTKADAHIRLSDAAALLLQGEPLDPVSPFTVMLHKPVGYTCSHDEHGALIYDLLPYRWKARKPALSTAGRLDKDSTGQVILTDDGALLHRIIHPKHHAKKHYRVSVKLSLQGNEQQLFASGEFLMSGDSKPLKPAFWQQETAHSGIMQLQEGRFHQIRRMFATLGNEVETLHRFQTGGLALGDLAPGGWRILNAQDLDPLEN